MPETAGVFPYNLDNLVGGAVRVLFRPYPSGAPFVPVKPGDIHVQKSPYTVAGAWKDFGATKDESQYSRSLDKAGWEIQQVKGAVFEEVSDSERQITVSLAEIEPEALQIIEAAATVGTTTATTGNLPAKEVKFGNLPSSLPKYNIAMVAQRNIGSGVVNELPAKARGRFVTIVGYYCEVAADESAIAFAKGEVSSFPVTFKLFPCPDVAADTDNFGVHWLEDPGTMT